MISKSILEKSMRIFSRFSISQKDCLLLSTIKPIFPRDSSSHTSHASEQECDDDGIRRLHFMFLLAKVENNKE
jgi:hypothetical protein